MQQHAIDSGIQASPPKVMSVIFIILYHHWIFCRSGWCRIRLCTVATVGRTSSMSRRVPPHLMLLLLSSLLSLPHSHANPKCQPRDYQPHCYPKKGKIIINIIESDAAAAAACTCIPKIYRQLNKVWCKELNAEDEKAKPLQWTAFPVPN